MGERRLAGLRFNALVLARLSKKSSEGYAARRQGRRSAVLAATRAASHGGPTSEEEEGLELRSPGNQSGSDEEAGPLIGSVRSEEHG